MKVSYEIKTEFDIKDVKELLKPFGGRCAKVDGTSLVYQIKDENEKKAFEALKEKGYIG
ncbi:hypothetical protein [Anaerobacillus alkalidiazotrophicus]|uniref:hypothetical protein n=1 Tax=Anaerobacillus alkalidiazotrophicus TaxID=472963 RepID=UPI001471F850|nr:hypothetical protein [Anaerobacillus alkalidiazotrophicus]